MTSPARTVGLAKITIARGDDAANELAVMRIVEKTDRLPGDRARRAAAAIAGDDKNVGFVYLDALAFVKRYTHGGQPQTLDEPVRIFGTAGEVDDQAHTLVPLTLSGAGD